jgi:hypothetical protein
MNSVVLLPDGVGIRNFFCTEFVDLLHPSGDVCVWHGLSDETIAPLASRLSEAVQWKKLPAHRETLLERVLRQAKLYAQLYWKQEGGLATPQAKRRMVSRRARLLSTVSKGVARCCATPVGIVRLHRLHERAVLRSAATIESIRRFQKLQPDVVFCTHQRGIPAVPCMAAARRLSIPAATFIYSWDNLPKGRMAVHADHFFVWSDWMRAEMSTYYPEVSAKRVHVVGTPQFEHYFNTVLLRSRQEFLQGLGLDHRKPLVCFSGDDVTTSPFDPEYLADTARAIRQLDPAGRPGLVFRRCPTDLSDRFRRVLHEFPEIRVSEPLWQADVPNDWSRVVPTQQDIALLANLVSHTDVMVNLGSTMAMDAAIFGKPSIYLAYDPAGGMEKNVDSIYNLPHFGCVHELQPVYWARSATDLPSLIPHALKNPCEKEAARQAWLSKIVAQPMQGASRRCVAALRTIVAGRAAEDEFRTGAAAEPREVASSVS